MKKLPVFRSRVLKRSGSGTNPGVETVLPPLANMEYHIHTHVCIERLFSFAHTGSFQVSCETQEKSTYAWEDIPSISKVQCCNFYTQFLQLQQRTLNMVFSYSYFDFVIHPRRYLKLRFYWTNTIRFDVEVKLWKINPEYAEVLCWLEDRSIRRVNVHRVTSSHLQKAYLIKIWLASPSMTRMVFDSMTLESGYVTSRRYCNSSNPSLIDGIYPKGKLHLLRKISWRYNRLHAL